MGTFSMAYRTALLCFLAAIIGLPVRRAQATCAAHEPTVSYNGRTFKVSFCAENVDAKRCTDGKCQAGLTLRRAKDAFQIDCPAKALSEKELSDNVTLICEVGPGFVEYDLALWSGTMGCGDSARDGCRKYKYLLGTNNGDMPLWSFPQSDWGGEFTRIDPLIKVQVLDAGGGADLVKKARAVIDAQKSIARGNFQASAGEKAKTKRSEIEVLYRAAWHYEAAYDIIELLKKADVGLHYKATQWPEAPTDFVVAVGGQ
jgi:hypothetical protein